MLSLKNHYLFIISLNTSYNFSTGTQNIEDFYEEIWI